MKKILPFVFFWSTSVYGFCQNTKYGFDQEISYQLIDSTYAEHEFRARHTFLRMSESGCFIQYDVDSSLLCLADKNKIIDLDTIITLDILLKGLHLSDADTKEYLKGLKKRKLNRPEIFGLQLQGNDLILTYRVTYPHRFSETELLQIPSEIKKKNKLTSNDYILHSEPLFVFFSLNSFKILNCIRAKNPSNYSVDQFSGCYKGVKGTREYYLPIKREASREMPMQDTVFAKENLLFGKFVLEDSVLKIKSFLPFLRPRWYARVNVGNNYSDGSFQSIESEAYYYLSSYPYFVNITSGIEYSVPENKLQEICHRVGCEFLNSDEPKMATVGIIKLDTKIRLLSKVIGEHKFLYFDFDKSGNFIDSKLFSNENKTWITDGEYLYSFVRKKQSNFKLIKFKLGN